MKFTLRDLFLVTVVAVGWFDVGPLDDHAVECRPKESAYVPLLDPGIDAGDAGGGARRGGWIEVD
jgi:hypothetical protein